MENLVIDLGKKTDDKSEFLKRIFIVGHRGFIGRHLSNYLHLQGFEIIEIDPRISEHKNFPIYHNDLFLDCSRIKDFKITALKNDEKYYSQFSKWVASNNSMLLRIGSNLEVALPTENTDYANWSMNRTRIISNLGLHNRMKVLLVPNVFGGDKPNSVFDFIVQAFKEGKRFKIDKPETFRDFLSMNSLLPVVHSFLIDFATDSKSTQLITTGWSHQVGSVQEFLHSNGDSELISKKFESNIELEKIVCEDSILEYLKKVF